MPCRAVPLVASLLLGGLWLHAQGGPPPLSPAVAAARAAQARETAEDHADMQRQLGILSMRPGPSGNPAAPDAANSDEATAMPFTDLPDPLRMQDGTPVATRRAWARRRAELLAVVADEVYGHVPPDVPAVTWHEVRRVSTMVGGREVRAREFVGRVDHRRAPAITVEMSLLVVTPVAATPVPLVIMFRGGGLPGDPPPPLPPGVRLPTPPPGGDPPGTEQLIAAGWGYAFLNPVTVQADNGAGLTRGIIGLTNRGARRRPEQWGALRAWAWGASRALDHLSTDPTIDATRVAIEGVSRYGKAALVTMAVDTRFAYGLIASSGAGGAKLMRRRFGEAIENLTGSGEYHWFAGRYLRYGAATPRRVARTPVDLPMDGHTLLALCAPRRVFLSHGIPEQGDAHWIDQRGAWMAAVAAQPVFRLLGARDLGVTASWRTAPMPPVNTGLLDGALAWRQHDGGHTDQPNWRYFIAWAGRAPDEAAGVRSLECLSLVP
ncbi:hypothetical protein [Luteitalea sp.]|uniref:glucuronyl esterase domain-containing protein n=1 Tax=Luteitalea sp. TaxID=2004800 RepID=UPI000AF4D049|nr:hypothetical protein [Luteitalea sp.]